jgi:predicted transposase/invertase (TIGR01784 family)
MVKFADPKNDVAFKKIFNEDNIEAIKDFAESIIAHASGFPFSNKLVSLEFLNKEQMPSLLKGKKSLYDLKVRDDKNNVYILEMQKRNEEDYLQRIQYYAAHAITSQLEQGISHLGISPVITISIMGKQCFADDIPCISYHPFKETTTGKQILLTQSHIFIELSKLEKANLSGSVLEWLQMFKDAPSLDHMPDIENNNVLNAYRTLEQHNWSSDEKEAYIASKIDEDIEKNNLEHAQEEGFEEGVKQGINEGIIQVAIEMLRDNETIEKISRFTKLSPEQIVDLKSQIKQ